MVWLHAKFFSAFVFAATVKEHCKCPPCYLLSSLCLFVHSDCALTGNEMFHDNPVLEDTTQTWWSTFLLSVVTLCIMGEIFPLQNAEFPVCQFCWYVKNSTPGRWEREHHLCFGL